MILWCSGRSVPRPMYRKSKVFNES